MIRTPRRNNTNSRRTKNIDGRWSAKNNVPRSMASSHFKNIAKNENLPRPTAAKQVDMSKPVKVFILMGQSNMLGFGRVSGNTEGCLDYTVTQKGRFTHLMDGSGNWTTRNNVRNVFVSNSRQGGMALKINDWLSVSGRRIGPEIQLGSILGEAYDGPVLILKSCIGNRSLGWDLLPPGSEQYEYNGNIYAGYKETPLSWPVGTEPVPINWYAGKQWDDDTQHAKNVLADIANFIPGAQSYEIAGFVFWQGYKDASKQAHASRYEHNLVHFIKALRQEFNAPEAKFVCATLGHHGYNMRGRSLMVCEAQLAVSGENGKYSEFQNNVRTVDTRGFWRDVGPKNAGPHYNENAETYMEVGNAIGWSMLELLNTYPPQYPSIIQVGTMPEEENEVVQVDEPPVVITPEEEKKEDEPGSLILKEIPRPVANLKVDMRKPVKVVILLGDILMYGDAPMFGQEEGSLEYSLRRSKKYKHLMDDAGNLLERNNVREIGFLTKPNGRIEIETNQVLKADGIAKKKVCPGLQLGSVLGEEWKDEPVLILKACFKTATLGFDMLPPGSVRYEFEEEGRVYAGYHDNFKWYSQTVPPKHMSRYAGQIYDLVIGNCKLILQNLDEYYPNATSYEVAAFCWWQGAREQVYKAHVERYETNLVNLIKSTRNDFNAPDAKFVVATTPYTNWIPPNAQTMLEAQSNVSRADKYPEFRGNVRTVNIRPSWQPPRAFGEMRCIHADVYMEIGDMLSRTLLRLLKEAPMRNRKILQVEDFAEKDESDEE